MKRKKHTPRVGARAPLPSHALPRIAQTYQTTQNRRTIQMIELTIDIFRRAFFFDRKNDCAESEKNGASACTH